MISSPKRSMRQRLGWGRLTNGDLLAEGKGRGTYLEMLSGLTLKEGRMNQTIQIRDELARHLAATGGDLSRRALEGFGQPWIPIPVRVVVADAGPIHYLVLIGHAKILPDLFEKVIIPSVVCGELGRPEAPDSVRA